MRIDSSSDNWTLRKRIEHLMISLKILNLRRHHYSHLLFHRRTLCFETSLLTICFSFNLIYFILLKSIRLETYISFTLNILNWGMFWMSLSKLLEFVNWRLLRICFIAWETSFLRYFYLLCSMFLLTQHLWKNFGSPWKKWLISLYIISSYLILSFSKFSFLWS